MYKRIATFIAGAAAVEIINHTVLMTNSLLPMHFWGIIISRQTNFVILIGWVIVFLASAYYAWMKK